MYKVLPDTNALIMVFQRKLNIDIELTNLLGNYEILIPTCVIHELDALAKNNKYAKYALSFVNKCKKIESNIYKTDDILLELGKKENTIIITNDKKLKSKLRDLNIPVIYVKKKSYLKLEGII